MRLAFCGDDMSIRGFFLKAGGVLVAGGIGWGLIGGDPDVIKERVGQGVDGGFAAGEGIAKAVPENVGRILGDNGYDVDTMTAEDWADAAADKTIEWGDTGYRFLSTYAERLGLDLDTIEVGNRGYTLGDCRGDVPHPECDLDGLAQD